MPEVKWTDKRILEQGGTKTKQPPGPFTYKHPSFDDVSSVWSNKILVQIWKERFSFFPFSAKLCEKAKATIEFLNSANKKGISDSEALRFIDYKEAEWVYETSDQSKGQRPCLIFVSNNSADLSPWIFTEGMSYAQDGILFNGAYGTASGMRTSAHIEQEASDFTVLAYMLNHLLNCDKDHLKNNLSPYIPFFITVCNERDEGISDKKKAAALTLERIEKLKEKIKTYGHEVISSDNLNVWKFHSQGLALLPVIHDLKNAKFYTVLDNKKGSIIPLCTFFKARENLDETTQTFLKNIEEYMKNPDREYIAELIKRRKACKTICCVDSRCGNYSASGSIKLIGACPSDRELVRIIGNENTSDVRIVLHESCGYVATLLSFNQIFKKLKEAYSKEETKDLAAYLFLAIKEMTKGNVVANYNITPSQPPKIDNIADKLDTLNLNDTEKIFFTKLFEGSGSEHEKRYDLQCILKHMYDRGIIIEDADQHFQVPVIERVDTFLRFSMSELSNENRERLYLNQLALYIKRKAEKLAKIYAKETNTVPKSVIVEIESLKNGGLYIPKDPS